MLEFLRSLFSRSPPPDFAEDSFIVWEPCTHSHAEVVPGYVKYLRDLGLHVHVFMTPKRYDEGLFSRFSDSGVTLHRLTQRNIRQLFHKRGIGAARGIMITTARKLSGKSDYDLEQRLFAKRMPQQLLLLVEHDVKPAFDHHALTSDIITLRQPYYREATTTVVNPHYFGTIRATTRNEGLTRFITIGAMRSKRRNTQLLVEAVTKLHAMGRSNFIVTVIGRGSLKGIPSHLHRYFDIKGRVDYVTLYDEMERADYFLTLLDPDNPAHERYITTGTSGSFQLIYAFAKPCLIAEKFAARNGLNERNSLIYDTNAMLANAMQRSIDLGSGEYARLQQQLQSDAAAVYKSSLKNLAGLINAPAPAD